jgi:GntR family transcriptional regulator / MocR family aminotransferase
VRAGGLTQTLHRQLRAAIIERRLPGGFALPSTRRLADHLGVGRNTVIEAYDLLVAQGHALTRPGTRLLVIGPPDAAARVAPRWGVAPASRATDTRITSIWRQPAARIAHTMPLPARCFRAGVPEDLHFDHDIWRRSTARAEDPGYAPMRAAFTAAGARLVPVPVDEQGLRVDRIPSGVKVICVTPSHQSPTGAVMSAARRAQLLTRAQTLGAVVIEDDYDGEFLFDARPHDALQTLDLVRGIEQRLGRWLQVLPGNAGLHRSARVCEAASTSAVLKAALEHWPGALPLSAHAIGKLRVQGLCIGYGCVEVDQIARAVGAISAQPPRHAAC